jgi:hypothetical protein
MEMMATSDALSQTWAVQLEGGRACGLGQPTTSIKRSNLHTYHQIFEILCLMDYHIVCVHLHLLQMNR